MFLCDTSSMKTDSLFSNDFSFVFTPVKEKPQESTLFWPVCNSTRFLYSFSSDFVFIYTVYCIHWISPLMLLHRCPVELLTQPQLQPGLRLYTCHMQLPMPKNFDVTVLKFVCCTALMIICSYNSQHTFRAWWPAVLWNGLLLFGGTKGYIQMTMMAMSSVQIRVKNSL